MKLKYLLFAMFSVLTIAICGCGTNGGDGLNGSITVTAAATGPRITATAIYTNPTQTNLIGVPIDFSVRIGSQTIDLGKTAHTNNSGAVTITFDAPPFNGSQTITVIARSDNLVNFATVNMTGRSLTVTAPPAVALTATSAQAPGTPFPFAIQTPTANISISDPFSTDLAGHPVAVSFTVVSTNPADTLVLDSPLVTTNSSGTASLPTARGTLIVPSTVNGVETMTINWTVTDQITGLTGSGTTTVTLTKAS